MAPRADHLAALSETQREKLVALLLDFDVTWTPSSLAGFVEKLRSEDHALRQVGLSELVTIDLGRQWKVGNEPEIEDYLDQFPELGTAATVAAELLLAEYQARELKGGPVKLEDFARRFPQRAETLKQLLEQSGKAASRRLSSATHTDSSRGGEKVETKAEPMAASWDLPKEFGRYRILKRLGEGGMGSVFLAHDTELDRHVAIKVPKFAGAEDPRLVERFYREARAAAKLQNRHICSVYDVGEIDGVRYISMAYIKGRPLSAYIRTDRTQPERSSVLLVSRLARALQEAHAQGIIHRDLKPDNIMINRKREPVIMDFGLARLHRQADSRLTNSGTVLGTPAYMSPEQACGETDRMGPATDIYSLGVVFFEVLTGRVPFEGPFAAVLGQIMTQEPPNPSRFRENLAPGLEHICLKMMAKRIEDRYASMQDVADALAAYLKRSVGGELEDEQERMSPRQDEHQQLQDMFATQYARGSADVLHPPERKPPPTPMPAPRSRPARPPFALTIAAGALLLTLLGILFGVLILLRTPRGTLRIDVDDPDLTISVDGNELTIEELQQASRLQIGGHRLAVKLGETVLPIGGRVTLRTAKHDGEYRLAVSLDGATLTTESFTIVRGDRRVVEIGLEKLAEPLIPKPEELAAKPPEELAEKPPEELAAKPGVSPAIQGQITASIAQAKQRLSESRPEAIVAMYLDTENARDSVPQGHVRYRCFSDGGGYSGDERVPLRQAWTRLEHVHGESRRGNRIELDPGPPYEIINLDVALAQGEVTDLGRIVLKEVKANGTASIHGAVKDSAGNPLPNVPVVSSTKQTRTDADGQYVLDGFGLEVVSLTASKNGYFGGAAQVSIRNMDNRTITQELTLFRPRRVRLKYAISGKNGESLAGPNVEEGTLELIVNSTRIDLSKGCDESKSFSDFVANTGLYLGFQGSELTIRYNQAPMFFREAASGVPFESITEFGRLGSEASQHCPPLKEGSVILIRAFGGPWGFLEPYCAKILVEEITID